MKYMVFKEYLLKKKKVLMDQFNRGRLVSEQIRAEKIRKKSDKIKAMDFGAKRAIAEGLVLKKSPLQVMREEWVRRKFERDKKYNR